MASHTERCAAVLLTAGRKGFVAVTALARPSAYRGPEKVTLVTGWIVVVVVVVDLRWNQGW